MKRTIGKRLAHLTVVILGVSFLTFLLMYISPGDPAQKKLTAQGVAVSQEVLEATRQEMGLDRPFLTQYGDWLGSACGATWVSPIRTVCRSAASWPEPWAAPSCWP